MPLTLRKKKKKKKKKENAISMQGFGVRST
jgi:hypothetical protein